MASIAFEAKKDNSVAKSILGFLDASVSHTINQDREYIGGVIKRLYDSLTPYSDKDGSCMVSFSHGGSAYEGLAVTQDADCDITVLLGKPFEVDNFHVERDEASKFFTLTWKSHVSSHKKILCDGEGYIDAAKIRSSLFQSLGRALQNLNIPGAQVNIAEGLAALAVEIERESGRKISMDFVPQIVFRSWGQCPDLLPLSDMPKALTKYIDTLNKNKSPVMCFPIAVPNKERYSNSDQLFNISFSLLEKEYFKSNTEVRDMVRLVKFVAHRRGWKKFSFKSYYAKRVAIKNDENLRHKSLWEGYQLLLKYIRDQLAKTGTFDGYFVDEQVTYKKDRAVIDAFIREIDTIRRVSAEEIKRLL